jgi:hypothetical protein
MGRKKLAKKDKKVRLSIWKSPKDIKILGGEKTVKHLLNTTFNNKLIFKLNT